MHKVGIVGIGKRTRQFYIPILEKLEDFEIVGFNTRTESNGIELKPQRVLLSQKVLIL